MLCGALADPAGGGRCAALPRRARRGCTRSTKASTVGFGLVAIGAALALPTANDVTSVLLAFGLQLLTLPVAATLIANSTYWAERIPAELPADDELEAATNATPPTKVAEPATTTSVAGRFAPGWHRAQPSV